jgi:hypothetical protein
MKFSLDSFSDTDCPREFITGDAEEGEEPVAAISRLDVFFGGLALIPCRKIILGNVLSTARLCVHYIHKDYNQSMNIRKLITID